MIISGGPTPREPGFRACACCLNKSPPARAGGTAGRWAIPVPGNPQTAHHQQAQSTFTNNRPWRACMPDGGPLGFPVPRKPTPPSTTTTLKTRSRPTTPGTSPAGRRAVGRRVPGPAETCSNPGDFATGCPSGRSGLARESQRFPGFCACLRPTPPIEAPRREPGGRRAVGLSRPPEARTTVHHHDAQNAAPADQPVARRCRLKPAWESARAGCSAWRRRGWPGAPPWPAADPRGLPDHAGAVALPRRRRRSARTTGRSARG